MAKTIVEMESYLPLKTTLDLFIKLIEGAKDGRSNEELSNEIQSFIGSNLITKIKK